MTSDPITVRILKSEAVIRQEALKGVISLLLVGAMVGLQWWASTPEVERNLKLKKLGVTRCSQRQWHFQRGPLSLPRHCLCTWREGSPAQQRAADAAELAEQTK